MAITNIHFHYFIYIYVVCIGNVPNCNKHNDKQNIYKLFHTKYYFCVEIRNACT